VRTAESSLKENGRFLQDGKNGSFSSCQPHQKMNNQQFFAPQRKHPLAEHFVAGRGF
jgi:hypothetical protein